MKRILLFIPILFFILAADGCEEKNQVDAKQAAATERMMAESDAVLGLPAIQNWTEKRLLKQLYELRDQEGLPTFTYTVGMDGSLRFLCNSVGFGMPFSAQYSNPERLIHGSGPNGRSAATIAQPEPNGLFMPEGLSATWILCIDHEGSPRPVYAEPTIVVSPFELLK